MLEYIAKQFNDPTLSDFTITDGRDQKVYLHRFVVAKSPYFETYLTTTVGSVDRSTLKVASDEFELHFILMKALYTSTLDATATNIVEVIELANRYFMLDIIAPDTNSLNIVTSRLVQRWHIDPDWEEMEEVYSISERFSRAITWIINNNCKDVPAEVLDSPMMDVAEPINIVPLAFKHHRLDLIDHYMTPMPYFTEQIRRLSQSELETYFTPEQVKMFEGVNRFEWIDNIHVYGAGPKSKTLFVLSVSPLIVYGCTNYFEVPPGASSFLFRAPQEEKFAGTAYIRGLRIREVNIEYNPQGGEWNMYKVSWDFDISPHFQIYLLNKV